MNEVPPIVYGLVVPIVLGVFFLLMRTVTTGVKDSITDHGELLRELTRGVSDIKAQLGVIVNDHGHTRDAVRKMEEQLHIFETRLTTLEARQDRNP